MAVTVRAISTKFFNQYRNGVNLDQNLTEFTTNLAGFVQGKYKLVQEMGVSWSVSGETTEDTAQNTVKVAGKDLNNEGFNVGDTIKIVRADTTVTTAEITSQTQDTMYLINIAGDPLVVGTQDATILGTSEIKSLQYDFGLIENNEPSFSNISLTSNNAQSYYVSDIPRPTSAVPMQPLGTFRDWVTGSSSIKYVSTTSSNTIDEQIFEVTHEFIINPWFRDGELSNLLDVNNVIPPIEFNGNACLKYANKFEFRTQISNPNTSKINTLDDILGSTGYFNENYNGLQSIYSVTNITFEETTGGAPLDSIKVGTPTTIKGRLDTTGANFGIDHYIGAYVSRLPAVSDYENKTTTLAENFLFDSTVQQVGGSTIGSTFITRFETTNNTTYVDFEIDVDYSISQQGQIRLGDYFIVSIGANNISLPVGNDDAVNTLASTEIYDKSTDIPDLANIVSWDIYEHPNLTPYTDYFGWNEDGTYDEMEFQIDLTKEAFINSVNAVIVAFNPSTENYFPLDTVSVPFNSVVSGGTQQINEFSTRGFVDSIAEENDRLNFYLDSDVANTSANYKIELGRKINWKQWIENVDTDPVFYDAAEENNNLNFKTSNYSGLNGYEIRYGYLVNLAGLNNLGENGNTDYLFLSPNVTVNDYAEGSDITYVIRTEDLQGNDLGCQIRTDEDTVFIIEWMDSSPFSNLGENWFINRIEISGQTGNDKYELSSLYDYEGGWLKPLDGETRLNINYTGGGVVCKCLIDHTQMQAGLDYNLSGRINLQTPSIIGKLKEDGTVKQKEDSVIKLKENQ